MKLTLKVLTQGATEGKVIPIGVPKFVIGRDPQCQLRPSSMVISTRHCCLELRDGKAYACDLESTNGTYVNDQRLTGEIELNDQDQLRLGPLTFLVQIEKAVTKPATTNEDDVAQMLLDLEDAEVHAETAEEAPSSSATIMEIELPPLEEAIKPPEKKTPPPKPAAADTRRAAEAILAKYARRDKR